MLETVLAAVRDYKMLEGRTEILVGLSGGADSVALLHCLKSLQDKFSYHLRAAHLNHMLRGDESDRDEKFVTELCSSLSIPLTVERVDVRALAEREKSSIELAARCARYEFFSRATTGAVATAHTASDSLETMIFNLARGTAIKGLCGIPPVSGNIIRPLIYCTRQQIENYCKENDLGFVTDSTNLSDDYTRNKIRHNVIPVLREINPSADIAAARTAASLREDAGYLEGVEDEVYPACVTAEGIDTEKLIRYHRAVAKRVLKRWYESQFSATLEYDAVNALYGIVTRGGRMTLPLGVNVTAENGVLRVLKNEKPRFITEYSIEKAGNFGKINNLLLNNTVDCDKISGSMVIRTRKEGDKIRLRGRGVTKTLKKLFTEMKIPIKVRESLPVIADDEGVIWIHGIGVAERVAVDSNTRLTAHIKSKLLKD